MRLIIESRRRGRLQALIEGEGQDGYRQPEKSDEFEGLHKYMRIEQYVVEKEISLIFVFFWGEGCV